MQKEGTVRFLKHHDKAVKGVSFNPKERYIFASCSSDGKINIYAAYHSSFHYLLVSYPLIGREINAVKFTTDGRRILAALSSKKLAVLDVETGQPAICYENSCFSYSSSRDYARVPLATDPQCPYLAVTPFTNGKGVTLFDLRMPLPFDFLCDLHTTEIRDIVFINNSWPFVPKEQQGIATLTHDGVCKVTTLDGKGLHYFETGHKTNSIAITPEPFNSPANAGFRSLIMLGGDYLSSYMPRQINSYEKVFSRINFVNNNSTLPSNFGIQEYFNQLNFGLNISSSANHSFTLPSSLSNSSNVLSFMPHNNRRSNNLINSTSMQQTISQLKYGSNGGILYATCSGGKVRKFRRFATEHRLINELYTHNSEILDMDISSHDEFIITASKDKTVGVICLGPPNHGTTSYCELT